MSALGPGDRIAGRYRLLEELGGGGMGVVFRARDDERGRDVAIKILHLTSPEAARRLQREARATSGLDPARIAQVYDVGVTPAGRPFLVMEYVEGRTLRAILRDGGVERPEALRILREVASALGGAHGAGLVHRDVKPDNVIVRGDGRVVLLDFGIVKHLEPSDDAAQITTQLTFDGAMVGTPAYLAPEQALGRDVAPAADQFALAVTAFELLTGKVPWTATDMTRLLAQVLADTPLPASTRNPAVPRSFDAVLARALSKSPEARFPTIETFADALEAAERGVMIVSPSSHTFDGPSPIAATGPSLEERFEERSPSVVTPPAERPPRPRSALRALGMLVVLAASLGGFFLVRDRAPAVHPEPAGRAPPRALAVSSQSPLACPIFAVEGLPEVASRLGAAAASLACVRAKWYLGGSNEGVLPPAALLDAPVQPRQGLWDFYEAPGARERTLGVAKARGLPSLEGTVTRARDSWRIDLLVRAADGEEVARSAGVEAPYLELAIRNAVVRLWQTAPLTPAPIDPDVARWTAFPDIDAGLMDLDLSQVGTTDEACATVRRRGAGLGRAYYYFADLCSNVEPLPDAGAPPLDESSGPALVTSANALLLSAPGNPFSEAETRRIALELESMRAPETSRFGRASLSRLAGILWSLLPDAEHAHAALLSAVGEDPLLQNDWYQLLSFASGTGSSDAATSLAAAWFPQEPAFLRYTSTLRSDVLADRLRDGELAYLLEPTAGRTLFLGRALAENGQSEEARALSVTTPVDRSAPEPNGATFLLASIDLHNAMFARALSRAETTGPMGLRTVLLLAEVLGRPGATASRWAASFVDEPDTKTEASETAAATIALCMNAGGGLARRCVSRVERLAAQHNFWGVGGDAFLAGAKRFVAGDLRAAVNTWRPIVAGANDDLARLLPTLAFERAGEPDLAARIDARKMPYRQLAGISEATPREALRAFAHGDRARAKELATSVVQAWEVADAPIPAVADMRALLAKIRD